MKIKTTTLFLGLILIAGISSNSSAQSYPFTLPATVSGAINIKTATKVKHNNLQLGLNLEGFKTTEDRNNFKKLNPIVARYPHGIFANWHDWATDKTRVFGTTSFTVKTPTGTKNVTISELSTIQAKEASDQTVGLNEFESLYDEQTNKFKTVWTFNMSADGTDFTKSTETIKRYDDLVRRGLPVEYVEMGNENFYAGQRSSIIPNQEEYIKRAKKMNADLKARANALRKDFPNIPVVKTAVPMMRKPNGINPDWNEVMAADQSFYDAVIVHSYQGRDPDAGTTIDPDAPVQATGLGTALVARKSLAASFNDPKYVHASNITPNKPIWLTEWGVSSDGPNAVSALGAADCYMYLAENPTKVEIATWFTATRSLNGFNPEMIDSNGKKSFDRTKKTSYGSMFEIVRNFYEGSEIYSTSTKTSSTELEPGVKAISSIAAIKDGKIRIMVLNLTNKDDVVFQIKIDGVNYTKNFSHSAFHFAGVKQIDEKTLPIDTNPLELIQNGKGSIVKLPKLSINVIELSSTTAKENLDDKSIVDADDEIASIKVYPNPVKDLFTISLKGINSAEIIVTDLLGKIVYQTKTNEHSIQIAKGQQFVSGIYMVKVIDDNGNTYEDKLIVQ
ncbi:hypothetical protein B6A10_06020 [Flavobacterium sp. L1I52]|uniref:Secretion system C-terminal sorting domain-containing protein n=1 Tax=Flavobacterium pokkalii TaxID=1940408 RepID=A0ABR7URV9_9FLAO|nr:T9SS type A sorting domain-containing protein [Flavobacterium pokkalii]MBD0724730.1 hypothetical protein [Flavobacterium pokkalii]